MKRARTWLIVTYAGALLAASSSCSKAPETPALPAPPAGCGSDNDCKGDRICEAGNCVDPAPTSPQPSEAPTVGVEPPTPQPPPTGPDAGPAATQDPAAPVQAAPGSTPPRIGAAEPLVVVTEFGDLQCPYCARATTVVRELLETHGKPDGQVAFEWRHNPLDIHPRARELAHAALAAHQQGRFWQLHDQLFANPKALAPADLKRYAQLAGLDVARWEADRSSDTVSAAVTRDRNAALALGASGTPTFFINGRRVAGVRTTAELEAIVEEELTKGRAKLDAGMPAARVAPTLQRENNPDFAKYLLDGAEAPTPARRTVPVDETVWKVLVRPDDPARGPVDALVTLVEFGDFQCPFCARYQTALSQLLERYPQDVRLVFKQSPLPFHPDAVGAAEASLAAMAQGKFWPLHDRLFAHQDQLGREALLAHATAVGLDLARFQAELEAQKYRPRVEADRDAAGRVDARGTPNVFINGRKVVGARDLEELVALVEEELAKARQVVAAGTPRAAVYQRIVAEGRTREPLATQPSPLNLASAPAIGPEAAPIQVVVFGDFQCPFSSRLVPILDRIGRTFEGKMRLHFKHFPQEFHPQAQATAQAAVCAHEQGKFWDLYRQMFDLEKQKDLSPGAVRRYAGDAGLDMAAFDACASSDGPAKVVAADLEEARAAGVKGTPTVFVNGRRFSPSTGYNDRSFMRLFNGILE